MNQPFRRLPLALAVVGAIYGNIALAEDSESTLSNITVFGRGETRQVSEISKDDILANAPGTSPLLALSVLPGVNFNAADSQGNYEWGSRISIRGFSQNQLGFTLDDVPLGDMSYRNYNGLHISGAIASENIGKVVVSQGTGSLGTASSSNLGGTIQFYSIDPADKQGETFDQTFGSYANSRTFVRFDSGLIGNTGAKFSLSADNQEGNKWKGTGEQIQRKFNSKVVDDFENGRVSAFFNYSDSLQDDYMDLSKDSVRRLGYNIDYLRPNWNLAKQLGQAAYDGNTGNLNTPIGNYTNQNDSYYDGSGLREDWLAGATVNYTLNDKADIKATVYHHSQDGTGTWWVPDPRTWNQDHTVQAVTNGVALRELGFDINRNGVLAAFNYDFGIHKINTGIWYENNDFNNSMKFFAQENGPSDSLNPPTTGEYYTRWNYNFNTNTIQYHLQDTVKLSDQWTVNAGFKSLYAKTDISNNGGADAAWNLNGSLKDRTDSYHKLA
jgi:iron complex outermembrane recepter protein